MVAIDGLMGVNSCLTQRLVGGQHLELLELCCEVAVM